MTQFNVGAMLEQAKKEYGLGKGEYLKIKEGDNKMRLLSEPLPHQSSYKGQLTFKFLMFVLDRTDNRIKPYFMPVSIMEDISNLQMDNDWGFDGFPMPYDINVKATGAGTKEVKYSVIASPNRIPLTQEVLDELKTKDIKEFQAKLNKQQNTISQEEMEQSPPIEDSIQNIPF